MFLFSRRGFTPLEITPALKLPKFLRVQTRLKTRSILRRRPTGSGGLLPTGFTIIELVVVSSIIGIIVSVTLGNFAQTRKSQALGRAAQKLAFDIRRAQTLALGGVNMGPPGPRPRNICAYGISILPGGTAYLIYGNRYTGNDINSCSGNYRSNGGPGREDIIVDGAPITLESGITITSGTIDIAFRPPQPTILTSGGSLPATIILQDGSGNKRCITITTGGQVDIKQETMCP